MQGVDSVPRIRQVLRGIQSVKQVPFQHQVGVEAGVLQPVHGGSELPAAVCSQAVARHLGEGSLALQEAGRFVALEGVVPGDEGALLRLQPERA